MSQPETNHKKEYVILLDLLDKAINATRVSSIRDVAERERLIYAHSLVNRFSQYANTVLYLLSGTKVRDLPSFGETSFIDTASIDVLTRAAMEAFLVLHCVFYAPKTKEEKDFRYLAYKVAGLSERQAYPEGVFEYEQLKADEKRKIDEIHDKLELNAVFQGLSEKQKKRILKGEWRQESWRKIAINAGFGKMLASHMYRHLSGQAHSASLSVLQTQKALIAKETRILVQPSIDIMNVLIANVIQEYCTLFSEAEDVLQNSGESDFVCVWVDIGRRLGENLDKG